ncbi:MAG TPA: hypothetical protein VEY71_04425, partial [Chitinophagales bacterium]|nr:hypothetical protein [Chitinophagales bacterium]
MRTSVLILLAACFAFAVNAQSDTAAVSSIWPTAGSDPSLHALPTEFFYTQAFLNRSQYYATGTYTVRPFVVKADAAHRYPIDSRYNRGKIYNSLFLRDHVIFKSNPLTARINFLPDFSVGIDSDTSQYTYRNTRGIQLTGNITDKFFFNSTFYETQARFHQPVRSFVIDTGVVPGETRVKNFRDDGSVDFEMAMATIGVMPANWINVTAGFDKHFYGFGYRSMLWSDNAAPYTNLTTN